MLYSELRLITVHANHKLTKAWTDQRFVEQLYQTFRITVRAATFTKRFGELFAVVSLTWSPTPWFLHVSENSFMFVVWAANKLSNSHSAVVSWGLSTLTVHKLPVLRCINTSWRRGRSASGFFSLWVIVLVRRGRADELLLSFNCWLLVVAVAVSRGVCRWRKHEPCLSC